MQRFEFLCLFIVETKPGECDRSPGMGGWGLLDVFERKCSLVYRFHWREGEGGGGEFDHSSHNLPPPPGKCG